MTLGACAVVLLKLQVSSHIAECEEKFFLDHEDARSPQFEVLFYISARTGRRVPHSIVAGGITKKHECQGKLGKLFPLVEVKKCKTIIPVLFQASVLAVAVIQVALAAPDHGSGGHHHDTHHHGHHEDHYAINAQDGHHYHEKTFGFGAQDNYELPNYVNVEPNYDAPSYNPPQDPDDPELKDPGLKFLGIKLPFAKLALLKGLVKFPIFKPFLKLFTLKSGKILLEDLKLLKKFPGVFAPEDPAAPTTYGAPPSDESHYNYGYESPQPSYGPTTTVKPGKTDDLIPGKGYKAKVLFVVLAVLLPLFLFLMLLEMAFTLMFAKMQLVPNLQNRRRREAEDLLMPTVQESGSFESIMNSIR